MRIAVPGLMGIFLLSIAGLVRGGEHTSNDPELVFALAYSLGGLGLLGVLASGVALGIRLSRD